jgi:pimeloyl-ACP methyl ester carboxylesterase
MKNQTIIVLHGWGQDQTSWNIFKTMFYDKNIVLFDLPGFGNEKLVSNSWGIPEYSKWVLDKIKNIQGDKIIIGHSFGGRIASYLASQNTNLFKGLILYGAPCIYRPTLKTKFKIIINKIKNKIGIKYSFFKNKEAKKAVDDGMYEIFKKVVNFDQTQYLPKIETKTLLIWGEKDKDVPLKIANEINSLIKDSELKIIDHTGHNAHKENPFLFYGLVKKFIENL